MVEKIPTEKMAYLRKLYEIEIEYINKIIQFQDYHYKDNGEIVVLLDADFPNFKNLQMKSIEDLLFLYKQVGWEIRQELVEGTREVLLIFS